MPFVLLIVGAVFLIAAIRGKSHELGDLLKEQFTGPGSFFPVAFAILAIATIGTVEQLRPLARAFLVLFILVLILSASRTVNLLQVIQAQLVGRSIAQRGGVPIP